MDLLEFGTSALLDLLSGPSRAALLGAATPVTYQDGQQIHARGDIKPGLSVVGTGAVLIGTAGSDGAWTTTTIMGPGQSFGEFTLITDLPRTHDAVAVGKTVINHVGRHDFNRLMAKDPELNRVLLVATTQRMHVLLEFLDDLRRLPLPVHTAKLIYIMSQRAEDPSVVKCNQDELAFTLGVSRVSIGKALAKLKAAGVISLGYGQIYIPDPEKLAGWIADRTVLVPLQSQPASGAGDI